VPWQWGTTGVAVNTSVYEGDINTSAIWLDPPEELVGKINVVPEMQDVMGLALYVCRRRALHHRHGRMLKKARDALVAAKPKLDEHGLRHDREAFQQRRHGHGELERLDLPRA
jgi:spermidine/putrescine transport system substrate-binding protein